MSRPCKCGHLENEHVRPGPWKNSSIDIVWRIRKYDTDKNCICIKFDLDNLKYLQYKYEHSRPIDS